MPLRVYSSSGQDGGWEVHGAAVGEFANAGYCFGDSFFPFLGRRRGDDLLEGGGDLAAALPGFFGRAGPRPADSVFPDADFAEAGLREERFEFGLVGEAKDVWRIGRRRRNFYVSQEWAEHRTEHGVFFARAPGDERDAALRSEHASHFREGSLNVGNVHDAKTGGDSVEVLTGKWKLFGVGGLELYVSDATGGCEFFSDLKHFLDKIGGDYAARWCDRGRYAQCRFAGAAGEVKDMEAWSEYRALDDEFGGVAGLMGQLR